MSLGPSRWFWLVVVGVVVAAAGAVALVVPALTDSEFEGLDTGRLHTFPSKDRGPVLTLLMKPGVDMDAFIRRNGLDPDSLGLEVEDAEGTAWSLELPNGTSVEESRKVERRLEQDPDVNGVVGFSPSISLGAAPTTRSGAGGQEGPPVGAAPHPVGATPGPGGGSLLS